MEEEALLRRAREDARRIVQRLRNNPHGSPVAAASLGRSDLDSEVSISTRSLAGRIVRQTETNVLEESDEIAKLKNRILELEALLSIGSIAATTGSSITGPATTVTTTRGRTATTLAGAGDKKVSIVKEVSTLEEGIWIEKLSLNKGIFGGRKLQKRYVFVKEGRLWWNDTGDNLDTNEKSGVALADVVRLEFGSIYVGELMKTSGWKCLSMYTKKRSIDWKVEDDEDMVALMVVLGRLCVNASGGVKSRAEFVWKRAMCKIENKCRREKISMTQLLVEAVKRSQT